MECRLHIVFSQTAAAATTVSRSITKYWIGAPSRCTQPTSTTVMVHVPKLRIEQRTEVPELAAAEIGRCVTLEFTALVPSTMKVKVVTTAYTRRQMTSRTALRTGTCARQRQSTSAPDHQNENIQSGERQAIHHPPAVTGLEGRETDSRTESVQRIANAVCEESGMFRVTKANVQSGKAAALKKAMTPRAARGGEIVCRLVTQPADHAQHVKVGDAANGPRDGQREMLKSHPRTSHG